MEPYEYVQQAVARGESLLSLCCGIGLELADLATRDVTAVDIAQQYLDRLKLDYPHVKTVCSDALAYIRKQPDDNVDIVSIIDGIEHLDKINGLTLIRHMKRVARKEVLLFTPEGPGEHGYLKNEPHDAWGISGADEHQTHKSGWTRSELEELGFELLAAAGNVSQHGENYTALMMRWTKP